MKLNYRHFFPVIAAAISGLVSSSLSFASEETQPDVMFVLDSSNSMWGQIDGTAKTEIAKTAFEDFVTQLPDASQVGLIAYGHRRKTDCGDVETLVPVSPIDREKLLESVRKLKPRGKTPITETLRQAAESLGENDRPGQLVLISDGVETCGGDPCALAEQLVRSGVEFKAHVIGFDIASKGDQAKIACIAHLTGGKYLNAKDLQGLTNALRETVVQSDPVAMTTVRLTAIDKDSDTPLKGPVSWYVLNADTETIAASGLSGESVELSLEPGAYSVSAELQEYFGGAAFTVASDSLDQKVFLSSRLPSASVETASSEAKATSTISVSYSGPQAENDFLRITTPDGQRLEHDLWVSANSGDTAQMELPSEPGAYDIAYVWTEYSERVLAKTSISVTEASVSLDFSSETGTGTALQVTWSGPGGRQDYIAIVPEGGTADDYDGRWESVVNGSTLSLQAPKDPGSFEVIYVAGVDHAILARQSLDVVDSGASVRSVSQIGASERLTVAWSGPAGGSDWIGVSVPDSGPDEYITYEGPNGDEVTLIAPVKPGSYEVRYVLSAASGAKVLARQPLEVVPAEVSLEAPAEAAAGSTIDIKAEGPANGANWVGFSEPSGDGWAIAEGAWESADNISNGRITLPVPQTPGTYELRFVLSGRDASIAAKQEITVK